MQRTALANKVVALESPLVSILIPFRDRVELLETCLLIRRTVRYPKYEIILLDRKPHSIPKNTLTNSKGKRSPGL